MQLINSVLSFSYQVDLAWDDWGDGSTMSIKIDPTTPTVAPSNQTVPPSLGNPENEEEEDHVDYFADMTPRYKKPVSDSWIY